MHDIYSVKLRNVTPAAVMKPKLRASYFPYERFYIFHKEDLSAGLVDRMFYVYLLHDLSNQQLQESLRSNIDLVDIVTLGSIPAKKVANVKDNLDVKCRVNWHIKYIDQHVLVVPTYSRKVKPDVLMDAEAHHVGYARSKCCMFEIETMLGAIPDLIVNKENLKQPCVFCDYFIDGFQNGFCRFGDVACRKHCHIFLPEKRIEINLGETE